MCCLQSLPSSTTWPTRVWPTLVLSATPSTTSNVCHGTTCANVPYNWAQGWWSIALQAGHCRQAIAGRPLHTGHCRQAIADRPLQAGHCRQAIADRPLQTGHCRQAIADRPLHAGHCRHAIAGGPDILIESLQYVWSRDSQHMTAYWNSYQLMHWW